MAEARAPLHMTVPAPEVVVGVTAWTSEQAEPQQQSVTVQLAGTLLGSYGTANHWESKTSPAAVACFESCRHPVRPQAVLWVAPLELSSFEASS